MTLEFKDFPIVEVGCAVGFPPIDGVDAMLIGKFWALHKERFGFPHRKSGARHPAETGAASASAFHTWLVSESGEFAIELEAARFAVHWRRRDNTYPHFSDLDGEEGVLTLSLRELDAYKKFCDAQLPPPGNARSVLRPASLELLKVDHLVQGVNFTDFAHLAREVPVVQGLARVAAGAPARIDARSFTARDGCDVAFRIHTHEESGPLTIAIETRISRPWSWTAESTSKDLVAPFTAMNSLANDVYHACMGHPTAGGAHG